MEQISLDDVNKLIEEEYLRLRNLSLSKNIQYNNSLQNPNKIISKSTVIDGIINRIDDKLNRLSSAGINEDTIDTVDDIIGYLVHLRIAYNREMENKKTKNVFIDIRGYHGC
jgi:hypothetical protein